MFLWDVSLKIIIVNLSLSSHEIFGGHKLHKLVQLELRGGILFVFLLVNVHGLSDYFYYNPILFDLIFSFVNINYSYAP